jgi:predicted GNAT family N-acyltransferase
MKTIKIDSILSPEYQWALDIRKSVFVIEQNVPQELEVDQYETTSEHFLTTLESIPAATGRLRIKDNFIKFERIATLKTYRGKGVGKQLMEVMLNYAKSNYPGLQPYMHSQLDAVGFYEKLGWVSVGEVFYEANIPHRAMTHD